MTLFNYANIEGSSCLWGCPSQVVIVPFLQGRNRQGSGLHRLFPEHHMPYVLFLFFAHTFFPDVAPQKDTDLDEELLAITLWKAR